jgi:5-methylcytosine-specific restriction endonuclease McrA
MNDNHTRKEIDRLRNMDNQFWQHHEKTKKGSVERWRLNRIWERARPNGWHCELCGRPFIKMKEINIDHLIPRSANGSNERSNLRIMHRGCNSAKGNLPVVMFQMFRVLQQRYLGYVIDAFPGKRRSREDKQRHKQQCILDANQGTVGS